MAWLNAVLLIYTLIVLGGGIMAYISPKIQSTASLYTGIGAAVFLIAALLWARSNMKAGYGLATIVTVALLVLFVKRYLDTQKVMPGLALAGLSLIVLVCLVVGHFANAKAEG